MSSNNPFKSWLSDKARATPLGTWLMAAAPATAEALGYGGFDFLVVDMEHVPVEFTDLAHILRAIGCTPADAVVRLAWNDQVLIKRALDAGARTVMLPFVQNAEEAKAAAAYTRYPPLGIRGVAAVHRGSRFGTIPNYLKCANDDICTIVQLETPEAIERLPEIAAVEGIDALFVGPGDLSAAMGHIGNIAHPEVQALIEKAAKDAHAVGKPLGIVGPNPDMVKRFIGYGYDFAAIASDIAMMTGRANEWLAQLKGTTEAPATPAAAY
ncbi:MULTISPECIES: HpcH/HpaI aldolase family protein [Ensifer]|uniref:HpcH/HpaI aldolase family protein n=1 Tax=Ensifer TaxID=106591 RepID=UPI000DC253D6|nr:MULTISPECIES: aldolase/citrate lyase family protein [Ensifer]MCY1745100.1 aldolase/citrate lyase family protein [Ensifer sp. SL37]RAS02291.1 2-dehydro-3-deoxyglucarate aldolase/4-hydroxy-2-oxoheptanedioate aldolase [Ensifer adhaerens]UTV40659.1 aldolase/citrate lyase family protein [Ensifer adhaerens]